MVVATEDHAMLRHAFRSLKRTPVFTVAVIVRHLRFTRVR
jgi:hypothetical protein